MVVPPTDIRETLVTVDFDKRAQRAEFRLKRDAFVDDLSPQERSLAFSRIPSPFAKLLRRGSIVAGYVAIGSEADPAALLKEAHAMGCLIALPHISSKAAPMRFLPWTPGDALVEGPFGLQQPDGTAETCTPDVVLAPLVAFDDRLMRIGQGAGHYDRALSLIPDAIAVGLAWSVQWAPLLASDIWDIPLHAVLTEKSWITL
jgi:5-formyltetrahydrofolate cyclo-ligase